MTMTFGEGDELTMTNIVKHMIKGAGYCHYSWCGSCQVIGKCTEAQRCGNQKTFRGMKMDIAKNYMVEHAEDFLEVLL